MTVTVEAGACVVEVFPAATEVAVVHVPEGGIARVYHPYGVREYSYDAAGLPAAPCFLVVPGDGEAIGWGWSQGWYGSLRGVRNGHRSMNRDAWHTAARALQYGAEVVYVQYETRDYYGKPQWTAADVRVESGEQADGGQ